MAAISHYLKIGTLFINVSYMCDPSFIPFSGTRITIMPLQLRLKVIKGHWTLFQGHNIISKSRILILKMIGPSNTYTLAPWAPLNWKKCSLVKPCTMCTLTCLPWYSADTYSQNPCGIFARGHSRSFGIMHRLCHIETTIHLLIFHLRQTLTT